jgi:protein MpaA
MRFFFIVVLLGLTGCHVTPDTSTPSATTPTPDATTPVSPPPEPSVEIRPVGLSRLGSPLVAHRFGNPHATEVVLVFAAIHGDEPSTDDVAFALIDELAVSHPADLPDIVVVPVINPDGLLSGTRTNSAGVDLNRNLPATNWRPSQRGRNWTGPTPLSEPESLALATLVDELAPTRILSIHSIRRGRHGVNFDGPAGHLAELMAARNGYPVLETMGYPTPGSFGSWAGIDRQIPTITLELPRDQPGPEAWRDNREAIFAFLRGR